MPAVSPQLNFSSASSITCRGLISISPAPPGRRKMRRWCPRVRRRSAYVCSITWSRVITKAATMRVLLDGAYSELTTEFARCCDMFDGNDEAAVQAARERWSAAKSAGHSLTYWQQTPAGWEKRGA